MKKPGLQYGFKMVQMRYDSRVKEWQAIEPASKKG
jgi:hypothetical protein